MADERRVRPSRFAWRDQDLEGLEVSGKPDYEEISLAERAKEDEQGRDAPE